MNTSRSYINIWVHLIWTVKKREPLLYKNYRTMLCKHILENGRQQGIYVDMINGVEDHLHCLVNVKSTQDIATISKYLKGESSKWINENGFVQGVFEWQEGYGAFSVSPSIEYLKRVRNYIKNQEIHHGKHSFKDEMDTLKGMIEYCT